MARERYLLNAGEDTIHDNEIKLVTAKDKRKNWWYYHKRHLLVGIIAAAMVGSLIYSLVSQVEPDYTIGLLTSYSMPDVGKQQLESCIANYVFSDSDTIDYQIQQASVVRFMGEASTNEAMIYLHDEVAFNSLEDSFDGFFQYNDGTAMPEDAKDYENAMVSWNDLKGFAEFVPQTTEEDSYDAEVLTELFGRLRVSVRAAEGSSIEKKEKDMEYHSASLALLERIRNDEKLNGETAVEEG